MAKLASTIIQIRTYIDQIRAMHAQPNFSEVRMQEILQLATERLLLNISEATRRIPQSEKAKAPHIPWQNIADMGNKLRHNYDDVNIEIISEMLANDDLDQLRAVLDAFNPDVQQERRIHPRPSNLKS